MGITCHFRYKNSREFIIFSTLCMLARAVLACVHIFSVACCLVIGFDIALFVVVSHIRLTGSHMSSSREICTRKLRLLNK